MNKILIASAFFLLTGCASQPQVTSLKCDSDCKTEIANMVAYTGKFSYYTITKSTSNGFSASISSQDNYNYRSGSVVNGYVNVWIEGNRINVEAVNNAINDTDMVTALSNAKDYDWQNEKVHPKQSVLIDDRGMVEQLYLNNRAY